MAGDLHRISIHALLAESDLGLLKQAGFSILISIHALLAESDCEWADYPTKVLEISIHALLAESDSRFGSPTANLGNFNPRSPCGERRLPPS